MLLPEFTIRRLLLITTVAGCFFSVVALAVRGHHWAIGVSAGLGLGALVLLVQMVTYAGALVLSSIGNSSAGEAGSPFATDEPPEQVLPPQNSEW